MRKIGVILTMALVLIAGLTLSAAAVTTISDPNNGEMHLFQIFNAFTGSNFTTSQGIVNTVPILETIPANTQITVTDFAKFAGFTQNAGTYTKGNSGTVSSLGAPFPVSGPNGIFAITPAIVRTPSVDFGFADVTSGGGTKFTERLLNNPVSPNQSNGLIFQFSPTQLIVAFEDGDNNQPLGDVDFNDLVLNVKVVPIPLPASALLLGTGLLGLVGLRFRRK